jgi:hypothetical protein
MGVRLQDNFHSSYQWPSRFYLEHTKTKASGRDPRDPSDLSLSHRPCEGTSAALSKSMLLLGKISWHGTCAWCLASMHAKLTSRDKLCRTNGRRICTLLPSASDELCADWPSMWKLKRVGSLSMDMCMSVWEMRSVIPNDGISRC